MNKMLFGDIGGTNARIAYGYFNDEQGLEIIHTHVYRSAQYDTVDQVLTEF